LATACQQSFSTRSPPHLHPAFVRSCQGLNPKLEYVFANDIIWNTLFEICQVIQNKEEKMNVVSLMMWLLVGAIAGWLAGKIMKGRGFGLFGDIIIGIVGSVVGVYMLGGFLSSLGMLGSLITAVIGAVLLIFVVGLIAKR
jgi:uncharacterized membrane protein YeaQ/YmgE (transglycosylase-associated protein family)